MLPFKLFAVLIFTATTTTTATVSAAVRTVPLVSPTIMRMVMKVHQCEEPTEGWRVDGPKYFGGLGWLSATWLTYRLPTYPMSASLASPMQQARAMLRFATHYGWPDQHGCQVGGY